MKNSNHLTSMLYTDILNILKYLPLCVKVIRLYWDFLSSGYFSGSGII